MTSKWPTQPSAHFLWYVPSECFLQPFPLLASAVQMPEKPINQALFRRLLLNPWHQYYRLDMSRYCKTDNNNQNNSNKYSFHKPHDKPNRKDCQMFSVSDITIVIQFFSGVLLNHQIKHKSGKTLIWILFQIIPYEISLESKLLKTSQKTQDWLIASFARSYLRNRPYSSTHLAILTERLEK